MTAPGFDPIVITKTATNQVAKGGGKYYKPDVYNPDLPNYNDYKNMTIVNDNSGPTTIEEYNIIEVVEKDEATKLILLVAVVILAVIVVILCARHIYYSSKKDMIEARKRAYG